MSNIYLISFMSFMLSWAVLLNTSCFSPSKVSSCQIHVTAVNCGMAERHPKF